MAKKLVDSVGFELSGIPKVKGCNPVGSQILVEFLTTKEALGTNLHVNEAKLTSAPQGYVLALGPKVDPNHFNIKIGDRVIMSGGFTPLPEFNGDNNDRMRGLVEPHAIKGVLTES